tara:strand:- start:145 stop:261 length:117 start_codon:yes stop_codon:yes gene_type:complete
MKLAPKTVKGSKKPVLATNIGRSDLDLGYLIFAFNDLF